MATIVYRSREWYADDLSLYATEVLRAAVIVLWGRTLDGDRDEMLLDQITEAEQLIERVPDDTDAARRAVERFENTAMDDDDFARALVTMVQLSSTEAPLTVA